MKKGVTALVLALILALTASGMAEAVYDQHVEFTIWNFADDYKHYTSFEENPVVKHLNRLFNVTMRYQLPAMGTEAQNFTLMLGTGDYTDVMNTLYSSESMQALYEDGVIIDIAPYLEEYMPNYYALIQADDELRKLVYDDEGRAYAIYELENLERNQWGGFVYRRDILETMTGGNVAFPSGSDAPVTVEDWDYMLPLMKAYFDMTGMPDTACLIVPACGYVLTGELAAGFGASGMFMLSEDGATVKFGPAEPGFYNYVKKLGEWYAAGYLYQDFASRTNDMFYLPNPALTYGGAAGAWFGLLEQSGTAMSLPEYGLNMLVMPAASPIDVENGMTPEQAGIYIFNGVATNPHCISTACDEAKLARIMAVFDYMYTYEGSILKSVGLDAEQAKADELYVSLGLEDGAYWFDENGGFYMNERIINSEDYGIKPFSLQGGRLPGKPSPEYEVLNLEDDENEYYQDLAGETWVKYGRARVMPFGATLNAEENKVYATYITGIYDYVDSKIPRFIMGTEELNETTWREYLDQLSALGLDEVLASEQSAYERYLAR